MPQLLFECPSTPVIARAAALWQARAPAGAAPLRLALDPTLPAEGYRIATAEAGGVRLSGADERGLLYAVGRHLHDPGWRGTTAPEKPIRAIYFATHFHNYYHDAPVADVCRYVEELALWGCNTLTVWFDMHHYTGLADPAAQVMIARLRAILQAAAGVGMRPGLMLLANEAYASSPVALRADWTAGHDGYFAEPVGHYHVEICPQQPGGLELILRWREEMLDAFHDVDFGFIVLWPYDQGGCTCAHCAPWGANGFLTVAEPLARRLRQRYPRAKLVLSTWYYDHFTSGEWAGLSRAFATPPDWVDYLMADDGRGFPEYPLQHGVPGQLPVLSFPEISMGGMGPWGGYGANPRLAHWQAYWQQVGRRLAGSFPYSEGIFEDLNKVLLLQLGWDSQQSTHAIARAYAAAEFAPAVADTVVQALTALDAALEHSVDFHAARAVLAAGGWEARRGAPPSIYWLPKATAAAATADLLRQADAQLPPAARRAWRWRILFLRALLDEELQRSGGRPTELSDSYFDELTTIYHGAQAELIVSPVSRRQLTRLQAQLPSPPATATAPPSELTRWHSPFITTWQVSALQPKTVAAAPARHLGEDLGWESVTAAGNPPGFVNLHPRAGDADGLLYLANRFRVTRAGRWRLHLGHDGGVRVFVNGRAVLTVPTRQNPAPVFRSAVTLTLPAGTHELVIAFDTAHGLGWGLFACFELPRAHRPTRGRPVFPRLLPASLRAPL